MFERVKSEVRVILTEVIDAVFGKLSVNVGKSVAKLHHRHNFVHEKPHRSFVLVWKFVLEIGARFEEQVDEVAQFFFLESVGQRHFIFLFS